MMSILLLQLNRPDGDTDVYHLKSCRRYHLGRGSQCEVRILDMKMSRRHCAIEMIGGQWLLLDCGSTNGVKLNGERIGKSARLGPDAVIEAGSSTLEVKGIEGLDSSDAFAVADNIGDVTGPQTAQIIDTTALEPSSSASRPAIIGDEDLTPVRNDANDDDVQDAVPQDDAESDDEYVPAVSVPDQTDSEEAEEDAPSLNTDSAAGPEPELEPEPESAPAVDLKPEPSSPPTPEVEPGMPSPAAAEANPPEAPQSAPATSANNDDDDDDPFAGVESGSLHAGDQRHVGTDSHGRPITLRVGAVGAARQSEQAAGTAAAERSVIITLLGQKIGPIPRSVARDLKARELRGTLGEDDLRDQPRPA